MSSDHQQPPPAPPSRRERTRPATPSTGEGADSALAALIRKRTPAPGAPPPDGQDKAGGS